MKKGCGKQVIECYDLLLECGQFNWFTWSGAFCEECRKKQNTEKGE